MFAVFNADMRACATAPSHMNVGMDTVSMFKCIDLFANSEKSNAICTNIPGSIIFPTLLVVLIFPGSIIFPTLLCNLDTLKIDLNTIVVVYMVGLGE
jgi:hypothetical protein